MPLISLRPRLRPLPRLGAADGPRARSTRRGAATPPAPPSCAGQGEGRSARRCTGSRRRSARSAPWSSSRRLPRPGQPAAGTYEGRGLRHRAPSRDRGGRARARAPGVADPGRSYDEVAIDERPASSRPASRPRCRSSPAAWPRSVRASSGIGDQARAGAAPRACAGALGLPPGVVAVGRGGGRGGGARGPRPGRLRPRRVPVGARHAACGAHPRGARAARDDGRRDRAVPRQGVDEAGARRRRHPHPAPRPRGHHERRPRGRRADRLPADRQADRRRRLGRHPPRSTSPSELEAVLPRLGHVAEVSVEEFIEGEEFTFDTICDRRRDRLLQHLLVSAAAAGRAHRRVDQPADRGAAQRRRRPPRRRPRDGPEGARGARLPHRLHAHGVVLEGRRRGGVRRDRRPAARARAPSTS